MTDFSTSGGVSLYIGDTWLFPLHLLDASGNPIDLTGASPGAGFYTAFSATPIELTVANGGVAVTGAAAGKCSVVIAQAVTSGLGLQLPPASAQGFPIRVVVYLIDSLGRRQTVQIIPITPLDPRSTSVFVPPVPTIVVTVGQQGPAGPSPTINGHTGPAITLSAADLGAATAQQSIVNSLVFG